MLRGLRKKEGLSFEDIVETLRIGKIEFRVDIEPFLTGCFFRYSKLMLDKDLRGKAESIIGKGVDVLCDMGGLVFYSCFYEVVDPSVLKGWNGLVNFQDGKLEERTLLYYPGGYCDA